MFADRSAFLRQSSVSLERMLTKVDSLPAVSLDSLPAGETVLVIIDMVNGFAKEGALASPRVRALIGPVVALQARCRELGIPVVAFADSHPTDAAEFAAYPPHCVAGTREAELVAEIQAAGPVTVIPKNSTNGYLEPDFQAFLGRNRHLSNWVVVGDCTDICVQQFALAMKAEFNRANRAARVIVPANAVDTYDLPYAFAEPVGALFHDGDLMHLVALYSMLGNGVEVVREVH